VHPSVDASMIERLNAHESLREHLRTALNRFYRFEGKSRFELEMDIPF
jgi:hypothetical protein